MAVLHCHTCGWEQDDFWRKTYNPLTKLVQLFSWLWIPRYIKFDGELYGRKYIFSWHMLSIRIVEEIVNIRKLQMCQAATLTIVGQNISRTCSMPPSSLKAQRKYKTYIK